MEPPAPEATAVKSAVRGSASKVTARSTSMTAAVAVSNAG